MKRMLGLERPLKMLQSASDLDQILLRRGRTDLTLWRPIPVKLNFYHGLVEHPNTYAYTYRPIHTYTHRYMQIHADVHTHMHTYICIYIHIRVVLICM